MPLRIPAVTAKDVWDYVTRKLTNLSNTRAGYIDLLADGTIGLAALKDLTDEVESLLKDGTIGLAEIISAIGSVEGITARKEDETEWSTDPIVDNVASAALATLSTHTIPSASYQYPPGAVEVRKILLAMISASAQTAATHHIGLKIQRQVEDAGWTVLKDFTANPPLALAADGAMGSWSMPIDITGWGQSGDKLDFRFQVDSDNAGSVNYTTAFVVVWVYNMTA